MTVGTPDANGLSSRSLGHVRLITVSGDPATPEDEADVRILTSISDVLTKQRAVTDYVGELQAKVDVRLTDRQNGAPVPTPHHGQFPVRRKALLHADGGHQREHLRRRPRPPTP